MILETNYLIYKTGSGSWGDVNPRAEQLRRHRHHGRRRTRGCLPDVSTGVLAHMQHLIAYSGERVDPVGRRTREKQAEIIQRSKMLGRPVTFRDLTRRWAVDPRSARRSSSSRAAFGRRTATAQSQRRRLRSPSSFDEERNRGPADATWPQGPSCPLGSRRGRGAVGARGRKAAGRARNSKRGTVLFRAWAARSSSHHLVSPSVPRRARSIRRAMAARGTCSSGPSSTGRCNARRCRCTRARRRSSHAASFVSMRAGGRRRTSSRTAMWALLKAFDLCPAARDEQERAERSPEPFGGSRRVKPALPAGHARPVLPCTKPTACLTASSVITPPRRPQANVHPADATPPEGPHL